jgi:hypothetical protein
MKKNAAIERFSTDFTQFQIDNLALISKVTNDLSSALKKHVLDDYFMERVDEFEDDLVATAIEEAEGDRPATTAGKNLCTKYVASTVRCASNITLIALVLWMDGPRDGMVTLFKEAGVEHNYRA